MSNELISYRNDYNFHMRILVKLFQFTNEIEYIYLHD